MRKGFTLIELMIVIAIIAIIAAIAIPNLLESRVTSQESAAGTALKSGLLPAQVQFQAGGYFDYDGDGIGVYAVTTTGVGENPYDWMSGQTQVGDADDITLNLLAPTYRGATPEVSGYAYKTPITATAPDPAAAVPADADGTGERVWGTITYPSDANNGRRYFMINQGGNVYSSKPSNTAAADGLAASVLDADAFQGDLTQAPGTTYIPYRR